MIEVSGDLVGNYESRKAIVAEADIIANVFFSSNYIYATSLTLGQIKYLGLREDIKHLWADSPLELQ